MYLVFDIGGTNMRLGISRDGKTLDSIETAKTPKDFSEAIATFRAMADKLRNNQKIEASAGGVRSLDLRTKDRLVNHPNIPLWVGEPLKEELEKVLGISVDLENDTAMVGLGEAIFGAGAGKKIVAYISVSTGVGGVRIVDGKIDQNMMGFEPGFQIIDADCSLEPKVSAPGYLERYISGNSIAKRYGSAPENLTDLKVWDETARILAIGLNNTIVHWSPEVVILGGQVSKSIPLAKVNMHLKEILKIYSEPPEVIAATLNDQGGLLGSLAYLSA